MKVEIFLCLNCHLHPDHQLIARPRGNFQLVTAHSRTRMPPSRSKKYSSCIGYQEEPAVNSVPKPRQPQKVLTEEEKAEAEIMKMARKSATLAKKEWEDTLVLWVVNTKFRFPIGTMAMYKSDAKFAYSVTEKEILTLHHETIPMSSKTFFSQQDVTNRARRKFEAGANKLAVLYDQVKGGRFVFNKEHDSNVSPRKNFGEVPPTTAEFMQRIRAGTLR